MWCKYNMHLLCKVTYMLFIGENDCLMPIYVSLAKIDQNTPIPCQSVFEVLGGKHQCSNLKDELCMFYYDFVLIPEQWSLHLYIDTLRLSIII